MFESRTRIDDCQGGDLLLAYAQTIKQLFIKILRGVKRHSNHPDKSVRLIKSVSNIIGTTKTKMHIPYLQNDLAKASSALEHSEKTSSSRVGPACRVFHPIAIVKFP
jgi:hypothetical protein